MKQHLSLLSSNKHYNINVQSDWNESDGKHFYFSIETTFDKVADARISESLLINELWKNSYNVVKPKKKRK